MTALLELARVSRLYQMGSETIHALRDVSFTVEAGEYLGIVGSSGSGKSTLLNILGCLDTATSGSYMLRGEDVRDASDDELSDLRNREIGFVFQTFQLLPRTSALENVELPLVYRGVRAGERRRRAREALSRVGLASRMRHKPNELSGGQRQRVAIARALVTQPSILLADEPTGNLDPRTSERVFSALTQLVRASGLAMICATHNMDIAARMDRRVTLRDGAVTEMD